MFQPFDAKKIGGAICRHVKVAGDKSVSPTRWYNHLWLALFGWKTVVVFEVSAEDAQRGYRVGFIPLGGQAELESRVSYDQEYRMKVGHEDVAFFAVTPDGSAEITIHQVTRTTVNDTAFRHATLH